MRIRINAISEVPVQEANMTKEILISDDGYETRAAIIEDKVLTEVFTERKDEMNILGNIYKGRVESTLPGMQVAFVDIGTPKSAFLHISDIIKIYEYKSGRKRHNDYLITDILKTGQEVIVQVDKEPIKSKGPRVTAYISLPGRYLVYMPRGDDSIGVSHRIEDKEECDRLRGLITKLKPNEGGFIVRTAAEGKDKSEFETEIRFLVEHWNKIKKESREKNAPALIHEDLGLTFRMLRDYFTEDVSQFVIDSKQLYKRVSEYVESALPKLRSKIKYHEMDVSVFEYYEIEKELKRALKEKVWLKCGGYIIIQQTEAMVSIDVNTGKFVGKEDPDNTILKTNLEAVEEIARQIRLRDLGGIIVIDFIDMDNVNHRKQVERRLYEELTEDKAQMNILPFSKLGLIEMTRQHTKPSLHTLLSEKCPYCNGRGRVLADDTVIINILRAIKQAHRISDNSHLRVLANESIVSKLLDSHRDKLENLEKSLDIEIETEGSPDIHIEDYRIFTKDGSREIYIEN